MPTPNSQSQPFSKHQKFPKKIPELLGSTLNSRLVVLQGKRSFPAHSHFFFPAGFSLPRSAAPGKVWSGPGRGRKIPENSRVDPTPSSLFSSRDFIYLFIFSTSCRVWDFFLGSREKSRPGFSSGAFQAGAEARSRSLIN